MKKVLLLGTGLTALSALESLARQFYVVGVVRDLDSAATDDEVTRRARELAVPVLSEVSAEAVNRAITENQPGLLQLYLPTTAY